MSSRQEEKEARRRERMEQEERERKAAARGKRLQYVIGGILAAGIVAAVVVALLSSTGGDSEDGPSSANSSATLPEPNILIEDEAAAAANCEVTQVPNEGSTHEERDFTIADYQSNPPTSGNHIGTAVAADGIYEQGAAPLGELVHSLEHGRINVQYKPGTPAEFVDQLEAFASEKQGYHLLMYENATGMEPQLAATAWDFKLTCDETSPEVFDALRTFYDAHLDKAPEKVP